MGPQMGSNLFACSVSLEFETVKQVGRLFRFKGEQMDTQKWEATF